MSTCMVCLGDFEDESMIEDITGTKYCLLDSGGICSVCGTYELKCDCEGGKQVSKVIIQVIGGVAHLVSAPAGIEVEIIDLDNEEVA